MHHFAYRDGVLNAEGVSLARLAAEVGTPFYCYSTATLQRHYRVLTEAFAGQDALICFAVKANSNQAVLTTLARLGAGMDVGERHHGCELGVDQRGDVGRAPIGAQAVDQDGAIARNGFEPSDRDSKRVACPLCGKRDNGEVAMPARELPEDRAGAGRRDREDDLGENLVRLDRGHEGILKEVARRNRPLPVVAAQHQRRVERDGYER